ncbi:MAG: nuclear transport factor 2 family protein [Gammaproteobacteria bacterium]|nr:nuclear transport factor 2 family protein [Gammaproteobacteria bacterium]
MNTLRAACVGMITCLLLAACQGGNHAAATQALSQTDSAFSTLSAQQGFAAAFRRYALDNAVLLPEQRAPLQNRQVIEQSLQSLPAGTQLSWTLQGADASGDLGYTWGIYTLTGHDAAGQVTAAYGKYLSVWQRQSGDWKLAIMMFNTSPGPAG